MEEPKLLRLFTVKESSWTLTLLECSKTLSEIEASSTSNGQHVRRMPHSHLFLAGIKVVVEAAKSSSELGSCCDGSLTG